MLSRSAQRVCVCGVEGKGVQVAGEVFPLCAQGQCVCELCVCVWGGGEGSGGAAAAHARAVSYAHPHPHTAGCGAPHGPSLRARGPDAAPAVRARAQAHLPALRQGQGGWVGGVCVCVCARVGVWARRRLACSALAHAPNAPLTLAPPPPPPTHTHTHSQDGALSDAELNAFQVRCFNAPLQPEELVGVKQVVAEKIPQVGRGWGGLGVGGSGGEGGVKQAVAKNIPQVGCVWVGGGGDEREGGGWGAQGLRTRDRLARAGLPDPHPRTRPPTPHPLPPPAHPLARRALSTAASPSLGLSSCMRCSSSGGGWRPPGRCCGGLGGCMGWVHGLGAWAGCLGGCMGWGGAAARACPPPSHPATHPMRSYNNDLQLSDELLGRVSFDHAPDQASELAAVVCAWCCVGCVGGLGGGGRGGASAPAPRRAPAFTPAGTPAHPHPHTPMRTRAGGGAEGCWAPVLCRRV